jgi:YbbR domain-containing protein
MRLIWNIIFENIVTKIISVIIAFVIWFYVIESQRVEISLRLPIEYVTEKNVSVANDAPRFVNVKVFIPKAFSKFVQRQSNIKVNLSGYEVGLASYKFFPENFTLPPGGRVLEISPEEISFRLESIKRIQVPIRLALTGSPKSPYRVKKAILVPEQVWISGPESRVQAIKEVLTKPIDVSALTENVEQNLELDLTNIGVAYSGSDVPRVKIEIESSKEVSRFRLRNVEIKVLSEHQVRLSEKSVVAFVKASAELLQTLNQGQVFGEVDLRGKPKGKYKETVRVILPKNINLEKVVPERVGITLY